MAVQMEILMIGSMAMPPGTSPVKVSSKHKSLSASCSKLFG
eukprot:CAMPEP_0197669586 /NCGR_PEP_ID=MMETSP1338-20131121/72382_1 /TAXON_ID=43686 ORGANISM="Pelagodinium beii, Strain RCC1491" /NCGR_SAMPLE_ID=MMETSP1338 /ASSEMBLY_ACC=CAM_ASM_000754 /LENGTH=40 /DNA_ID= /DNA_START= /DNA_END= /DNA_ORIENTATION=